MNTNNTLTTQPLDVEFENELRQAPLTLGKAIWYGVLFVLIQIIVALPIIIAGSVFYGEDSAANQNLIFGIGVPLGFIIAAWVFTKKRELIPSSFKWQTNFMKLLPISLILVICLNYVVGEFSTFLPGYEAMLESYLSMFNGVGLPALLIGGALIGPICEEIVFRGVILEGLSKQYNSTKAIIFSSLIFSIVHLQPLQMIAAFIFGVVLGWIYLKTKSLWICIIIHVLNNTIAFMAMDGATETTKSYFDNNIYYFASLALAAIIAYLAYLSFQRVHKSTV
jgi:membrane protease YdiL (CAAX protease family)